eukprot:XP_015138886.1 neuronal PAS domain-containing protein 4 isoform X1 [Gallus gallus]
MGNTVPFPGQGSPNGWLCRSTKSASKARRDQINAELHALRSLLPISTQEKERLSYLHTMALVCLRLRGAHLFPPGTRGHYCSFPIGAALLCTGHCSCAFQNSASHCARPAASAPPSGPVLAAELLSLLPGFLLVLSAGGKLVYISENVSQFLGLSMVELLAHGDTIFDILDGQAREDVHKKLLLAQEQPGREITFVSEMRTSKAFRLQRGGNQAVAVRGHFMVPHWPASPSTTAFLALCTPAAQLDADRDTGSQDNLFQSTHALDMRFMDVTESAIYHLGYLREELIGRSWYSLLHPEDADVAAAQHRAVALGAGAVAGPVVLRVLRRDRTWAWLCVTARRGGRCITCTSRSLREEEAAYVRARQHGPPPPCPAPAPPPAASPPEEGLSLLAAQLRALADSLSPPAAYTGARPGTEARSCGQPQPDAALALACLLGDALEASGSHTAHARGAPLLHQ